jgi:NADH-quinone oxidoreductase subunit J
VSSTVVEAVVFYGLAALTVLGGGWVAFSRNIVHSAFALLATFVGVAGLYALLAADLLAVIQLLVYVGGVLVVFLFAVMLTARIDRIRISNRAVGQASGLMLMVPVTALLVWMALSLPLDAQPATDPEPTTAAIGNALLGPYVLPFEAVSVLLLAALVGAVVLARGFGVLPRRPRPEGPPGEPRRFRSDEDASP